MYIAIYLLIFCTIYQTILDKNHHGPFSTHLSILLEKFHDFLIRALNLKERENSLHHILLFSFGAMKFGNLI